MKVLKKYEKKEESDVNINKPDKVYFAKDKVVIRDMKKYKKRIITACIVLVTLCGIADTTIYGALIIRKSLSMLVMEG